MRFLMRIHDPLKQWKLSPMDLQSRVLWEAYTKAKEETFARTNIPQAPWYIVEANDKRRARLNCIDHLLAQIPYEDVPHEEIALPDRVFNPDYERKVLPTKLYVPSKCEQCHRLCELSSTTAFPSARRRRVIAFGCLRTHA